MINKKKKTRTVTFFYLREEEKQIFLNLVPELKKKKFTIKFSKKLSGKADIGFYCQTDIKKINSNISAIFLGGMDQGRNNWPNHWKKERWDKFDLGFLPGNAWEKRWQFSSNTFQSRTKYGVFKVGWPKADHLFTNQVKKNSDIRKINILYAPSFECCDKQLDVVYASKKLGYNLIIKHWLIKKEKRYIDLWENIKKANSYSKKIYKKIKIINPKTNFLNLLKIANLVITDESSVAYEALLYDIPTISVKNWKIQRHKKTLARPVKPAKITYKTTKKDLSKCILLLLKSKKKIRNLKHEHFSYIGKSSKAIVDVLESFLLNRNYISKSRYYIKPKKKISILERTKKLINI